MLEEMVTLFAHAHFMGRWRNANRQSTHHSTQPGLISGAISSPIFRSMNRSALLAAAADVEATIKSGGLAATKTKRIKVINTCFMMLRCMLASIHACTPAPEV